MSNKKEQATVNDDVSLHDLVKHESQRFRDSKAPKMSEITAEEFKKLVGGAGGSGGESVDYEKIREIIREELAALLPDNTDGAETADTVDTENAENTAKRQRKSEK